MEKRIKLAFAGKMQTGKDTAANMWIQRAILANRFYTKMAFADTLKDVCKLLFNLTDDDVNTQFGKARVLPEYGMSIRQLLQAVGQGMRDAVSSGIWVTQALKKIDYTLSAESKDILVTDVRYPNEVSALKCRGFTMIKMLRNTGIHDNHASERDLNDNLFDYIIDNNGSMTDLEKTLVSTIPDYTFLSNNG